MPGFLNKARNFLTRRVFKMKKENSPRSTERTLRRGSVLHIVKEHNNQTKRNKAVHKRRANELRAEVEAVKQGKATSLAPVPKAKKNKTMNNILKNLSAPTTKSKALQNRLTRRRGNVKAFEWSPNPFDIYEPVEYETAAAAAVAVEAAEAAEAASATAQQAAVVATQGTPVKGRYTSNLATINFSAPEARPNVGQHFNEFQANNWVRRGRVADLGHNFNVFGYEPVNERSKLVKKSSNQSPPAAAVKPDPLALLPSNWIMYTPESQNQRAANAKGVLLMKKIRGPSTTRYHGMPNRLNRMREA